MIKRIVFYLIIIAFVSHNILYFFNILSGKQPQINAKCPLVISFINTPLLFDRETLFFNTQTYNLIYPEKKISLTRRDIRKGLFSYFNMLYFSHWGKYFHIKGANAAIIGHYFCHKNNFMKKLNLETPISVERQIFDHKQNMIHEEIVECQKL